METMFSLCVLIIAIFVGCVSGFFGFALVFIIGVIVQSRNRRNVRREKERLELLYAIRRLEDK